METAVEEVVELILLRHIALITTITTTSRYGYDNSYNNSYDSNYGYDNSYDNDYSYNYGNSSDYDSGYSYNYEDSSDDWLGYDSGWDDSDLETDSDDWGMMTGIQSLMTMTTMMAQQMNIMSMMMTRAGKIS